MAGLLERGEWQERLEKEEPVPAGLGRHLQGFVLLLGIK